MSLLSKLSIVIPTFNRPEFLIRSISYWSDYDMTVHILDGAKVPLDDKLISGFKSNINYHHMPIDLMQRLNSSIEFIGTDYSMLVADDEFFISSALESCIEELENDHEIVSCMGSAISFRVEDNIVVGNIIYPALSKHSLMQDNSLERSIFHMSNYVPSSIYSVMRSNVWKKSIRSASVKNYEVFVKAIGELQFEITSSYLGKSKIINELMWLRSFENEPIRVHETEATIPIQAFWYEKSNKLIRNEIINTIVQSIAPKQDKVPLTTQDISLVIDSYIKSQPKKSFKNRAASFILPKGIVSLIKKLIKIKAKTPLLSISNIVLALNKKNVDVDIVELENIEQLLFILYSNQNQNHSN